MKGDSDKMGTIGKILLFGGFFVGIISQIFVIVFAFKIRLSAGFFCLLMTPMYAFVSGLRKETRMRIALNVWIAGLAMLLVGVVVLSAGQ
jgi:hypothetical protein